MADITSLNLNVTPAQQIANAGRVAGVPDTSNVGKTSDTEQKSAAEILREQQEQQEAKVAPQQERENIVATSEDGDTLQVSNEGETELETAASVSVIEARDAQAERADKLVNFDTTAETAEEKLITTQTSGQQAEPAAGAVDTGIKADAENRKDASDVNEKTGTGAGQQARDIVSAGAGTNRINEASDSAQNQKITNFTGYTETQLEQMYRKGEISRYEYETEIQSREERIEQQQRDNAAFSEKTVENDAKAEKVDRSAEAVEKAYSPESSATIAPETRLNAMENIDIDLKEEEERQGAIAQQTQIQFTT